jgi:SAM-dependent methyltransferase
VSYFHQLGFGSRLIGVDGSQVINENNSNIRPFNEFHQSDLQVRERFPLKLKADAVTCSEVIEHMPNFLPVFDIAARILRLSGLFMLTTHRGKARRRDDSEHLRYLRQYDPAKPAIETRDEGFEIIRRQLTRWPALTLQKIGAFMFTNRISKQRASSVKPTLLFQFARRAAGLFLKCSSKSFGPPLAMAVRKSLTSAL